MAAPGPMVRTTTDLSTGSRLTFSQNEFDLICSDLASFPISRAAAASSAVPLVTSPVTINNYGGTCTDRKRGQAWWTCC
jgi:NTE family protein